MQINEQSNKPMRSLFVLLFVAIAMAALPAAAQSKHSKKSETSRSQSSSTQASEAKIDLNSASQKELEALPGVGTATAKKIIAGRPYSSVDDLSKSGVSAKTIDKITPSVMVGVASDSGTKSETIAKETKRSAREKKQRGGEDEPSRSDGAGKASETSGRSSNETSARDNPSSRRDTPSRESTSSKDSEAQTPPSKGMVWVNLDSKVYHREGTRWYGKTKNGKYMTEADAMSAGYRASKH